MKEKPNICQCEWQIRNKNKSKLSIGAKQMTIK